MFARLKGDVVERGAEQERAQGVVDPPMSVSVRIALAVWLYVSVCPLCTPESARSVELLCACQIDRKSVV